MAGLVRWDLCDTEFLDLNQTWYSEQPQFSPCFRDTLLVWLPACVLILAVVLECSNICKAKEKSKKPIPWNTFNKTRMSLVILLVLMKTSELISYIYDILTDEPPDRIAGVTRLPDTNDVIASNPDYNGEGKVLVLSALLVPIVQLVSHCILGVIYCYQRRNGVHTSGPVWFHLFISVICTSIDYYSVMFSIRDALFNNIELYVDCTYLPVLLLLFIFECRGDTLVLNECDLHTTDIRPTSPEVAASYCSSITFWWYNRFLLFGYRCRLRMIDLWKTLPRDKACELVPIFRRTWVHKPAKLGKKRETYHLANGEVQPINNMLKVLAKLFWSKLLFAASLKLYQDILQFVTPLILKSILAFMKSKDDPNWHGILWALLMLLIPTLQSVLLGNYFYRMQLIGNHVKTMIVGSVYRKALLLSGSSRLQSTSGEIVNLISVDSQRFQDLLVYVNLIWSAPFQIVLAIYLLYRELGWSVFAGVLCMCLVCPSNAYVANRIKYGQIKVMKTKDERIKQVNEVLSGIKVIKLYAWENSFIANLFNFRNRELTYLRRILNLDAMQTFLWNCCPFLVACATFAVYVSVDSANILDAEKAFVSISLFNLLRFPLTLLPSLVTSLVLTMVSARRLNKFLNSNELIKYVTRNDELEAIAIEGGTLSWAADDLEQSSGKSPGDKHQPILKDVDLHVKPRSFVAIVGQVASGKSSLLSATLGEMHRISGRFNICKSMRVAYVPQQAWIQNMTVKDNILFGSELDEERYQRVLAACSLQSDLATLPGGDQAEIGEKGINLSGGQKQRVSLARACYSDSDIYLMDDPLSALDSHVAKHVYDEVLSSTSGLLRNKTRVLATNSLFVLPHVDHIVVLDSGKVVESGSHKQLLENSRGYLSEFMRQYSVTQKEQGGAGAGKSTDTTIGATKTDHSSSSSSSSPPTVSVNKSLAPPPPQMSDIGKLIDSEKAEVGSVSYLVYLRYLKSASWSWVALVLLSLFGSAAFNISTNLWLSLWASDAEDPNKRSDTNLRTIRLLVYAMFGGLQCLFVLFGSLALCRGAIRAARILHLNLLERVMHSPMTFFDTTPIGRVVNRFAKDIDVVDSTLPGTFRSWISCFLQVLSTFFIICYSFPTFLIILIPLSCLYLLIQRVFIVTTRQLKRLESNTRSPIYSNFNETLSGMSTIRAYDCVDRFVSHSDNLVDRNQSCSYPNIIANRWLSVRLEFFGNLITAMAAVFSVYYKGKIGAGVAGLTISYSLNITQTLSWFVRMTSDLETHIVSVERILEYMQNKQEDGWVKDDKRPPRDWPVSGAIDIQQYSTRYRDDTDLVLKQISINIRPGEKIGIVGRTGSGKSSLSLALFRILEPASGAIVIDGHNLVDFGLHDIRSRLTIIPQDPVLFSGTLRFNLDPLKLYQDHDIWRALELAHLKTYISSLTLGLDYKVSEYGENFSVGQRQLICLARAILRKSKILILDEATASVDLETDSIVQKTIRDIFSDCTIITIAHRLHTILDSDRILVLDSGKVLELDSPGTLIENENSAFASLIRDAGVDTSNILTQRRQQRDNTPTV